MSCQEQTNQSYKQGIPNLEIIIVHLELEIRNVENNMSSQIFRLLTTKFLHILKSRAEVNIQILREIQNSAINNIR